MRTEDDGRWRVQQTSNALDMIVKSSIHVIRRCINTVPFLCDICYNVIMKLDRLELHINLHCDEDSLTQCRIECHRCWSVFCCTYGYTRVYVILCDILLFAVGVSMLWMWHFKCVVYDSERECSDNKMIKFFEKDLERTSEACHTCCASSRHFC